MFTTRSLFGLHPRTITATLLVAGTCIGGGMLALPVVAALGGFIPSFLLMLVVWMMMTATALSLVEIGFWMKQSDAHIMTMASTILGKGGKAIVWILFLFISYASLAAYVWGCGQLITEASLTLFGFPLSITAGCLLFILIFGPFLLGPRVILGRCNDLLFLVLIASYLLIIWKGVGIVTSENLLRHSWSHAYLAIPLLITAFSFQTMVPSLHPFLDHHKRSLRVAVVLGTIVAFIVYALWQYVIFGSIPLVGENGLIEAFKAGQPASFCLTKITHSTVIPKASAVFAMMALVTSFFGIGIGLFDFLGDGLKIPRQDKGAMTLGLLVLLPSFFFAISIERIFLMALDISGGFGDTLLNGVIPVVMLWVGGNRFAPDGNHRSLIRTVCTILLLLLFAIAFGTEGYTRLIAGAF